MAKKPISAYQTHALCPRLDSEDIQDPKNIPEERWQKWPYALWTAPKIGLTSSQFQCFCKRPDTHTTTTHAICDIDSNICPVYQQLQKHITQRDKAQHKKRDYLIPTDHNNNP